MAISGRDGAVATGMVPMHAAGPVSTSGIIAGALAGPAWIIVALLHMAPAIAVASGWFRLRAYELLPFYGLCALLVGCGWWMRWRGCPRFSALLELSALFYLAAAGTALSCAVTTALALPYADAQLAAIDRALGFDWPAMFSLFHASPVVAGLLARAYVGLNWAPQLLILLLVVFRPPVFAWRFLTAWLICLLLTATVYPFFPAVATFHHYDLGPEMMTGTTAQISWKLPHIMEGLRTGATRSLGVDQLTGVVTMPSFHAAGAIMLIHGYATLRWLRWPAALVGGAMFIAAVPVGGHYLIDVIAGLVLALLSILTANMILRRLSRSEEIVVHPIPVRPLVAAEAAPNG